MEESEAEWANRKGQELTEVDAMLRQWHLERDIKCAMLKCNHLMGRIYNRRAGQEWTPQFTDVHQRYVRAYHDVARTLYGSFNFSGDE